MTDVAEHRATPMCRAKSRASRSRHHKGDLSHWVQDVTDQVTGGVHRARQQSNWQDNEHKDKKGTQGGSDNVHNTLRTVLADLHQQRQKSGKYGSLKNTLGKCIARSLHCENWNSTLLSSVIVMCTVKISICLVPGRIKKVSSVWLPATLHYGTLSSQL